MLEDEPAWNFNEGMRSYRAQAYSAAALRFEKALSVDPNNVRLLAWSARAHLAAGNLRRGLEQVERIRSGPPSETKSQLLEDLAAHLPPAGRAVPGAAASGGRRAEAEPHPERAASTRFTASSSSRWVKGLGRKLVPGSRRSSGSICPSP